MRTSVGAWYGRLAVIAVVGLLLVQSPVIAQERSEPDSQHATTASDAEIPVDHLHVILRPLTKKELEIELGGWLKLLRAKIREVGDTELRLKALAENESASLQCWPLSRKTARG